MYTLFKSLLFIHLFIFSLGLFAFSAQANAPVQIRIAAYAFPPFLNEDLSTGLTPSLISLLNQNQDSYEFVLIPTSPKRRYLSLERGRVDAYFFEMKNWGWQHLDAQISQTRAIVGGEEIYIALNREGRDQSFFENLEDRKIGGIFGYHYGFANFNSDADWLKQNYNILLHHSHQRNIELVMRGIVDVGIVTRSYFKSYVKRRPFLKQQFLISEAIDQVYNLPILLSNNAAITSEEMENLLDQLKENGKLQKLFRARGLERMLIY